MEEPTGHEKDPLEELVGVMEKMPVSLYILANTREWRIEMKVSRESVTRHIFAVRSGQE